MQEAVGLSRVEQRQEVRVREPRRRLELVQEALRADGGRELWIQDSASQWDRNGNPITAHRCLPSS
jgi:hypothetical protein